MSGGGSSIEELQLSYRLPLQVCNFSSGVSCNTIKPFVTVDCIRAQTGTDGALVERAGSQTAEFMGCRSSEDADSDCLMFKLVIHDE